MLRTVSSCQVNIYKHSRCSLGNTSPTDTPGAPPPDAEPHAAATVEPPRQDGTS